MMPRCACSAVAAAAGLQGTYEALVRQGLNSYQQCPSGTNAVALAVTPSMISLYHTSDTSAGSYLTPNQLDVTLKAINQAATTLTDAKYGLLPQELKCLYPTSPGPQRADISLNAWAVWLVDQLNAAGPTAAATNTAKAPIDTKLASSWGPLDAASKVWRKALETQLLADATAARAAQPPRVYEDYDTLSWARLVLGADWTPQGASAEVQKDLSMQRLLTAVNNASLGLSVGTQARTGLALLGAKEGDKAASADVKKIAQRLLSNVRVGGRTAYVATGDGDRGAAGKDTLCAGCWGCLWHMLCLYRHISVPLPCMQPWELSACSCTCCHGKMPLVLVIFQLTIQAETTLSVKQYLATTCLHPQSLHCKPC